MLRVENVTRQSTLIEQGRVANNVWTRFKGLIGVKDLPPGDGLMIVPCHGVHCMFMSIPIDVLYVSKDGHVVAIDRGMKPWAIGRIYRGARYVLELPAGRVEGTGTKVGDALTCSVLSWAVSF